MAAVRQAASTEAAGGFTNDLLSIDAARAVPMIFNTIGNGFTGKTFTSSRPSGLSDEEILIEELISKLGRFAETNDQAFVFLEAGSDPDFWKGAVNWNSSQVSDHFAILAGHRMEALGISARTNVTEKLLAIVRGNLSASQMASARVQ